MVGSLIIGDQVRQTLFGLKNKDDYESYINSIDEGYDSEDSVFNGYNYKINTPQFNLVNRPQCAKRCDFKHEIIEYRGNNCFIPSKG